ncbi:MAG: Autophagy protein 22 [Cirrosporium novae-zelandiae]|nr:MAG: Autophagy protein 22 [Cirrosporium novae-zelandiae]
MAIEEAPLRRHPRYTGEDTRLTSKKELMGWYAYSLAAEIFAVCGVGSFLPITLEQLARERGVLWSDKITPCVPGVKAALVNGNGSSPSLPRDDISRDGNQCVVFLFGHDINSASFAMYTFSLSVLVQALALVSICYIADHGNNRKKLLLAFGFTGATATMLFLLVAPSIYIVGSFLVITSVTCLGSSFVILNSFLPLLVSNHPSTQLSKNFGPQDISGSSSSIEDRATAVPGSRKGKPPSTALQLSTHISSKGMGIGYSAALSVQCISIFVLYLFSKSSTAKAFPSLPLRVVLFLVGSLWFTFTIPASLWLRDRPGPLLRTLSSTKRKGSWRSCLAHVGAAWVSLWRTVKIVAKLKQVVIFLGAWFILSDAIATISGTAILFAKTELQMSTPGVALVSIIATSSGIVGAFSWPVVSQRLGLSTNKTILACIALFEVIPLYGLVGYIPFVKNWGVGGLQQPWEIYPMAFIHGFVMGGLSSYCRSFYGRLIPPGSEAAFYALYAVTDKGSSAFGPAIVGAIVDATGNIRPAFWFIAVLIVLPAPLIWMVDAERGQIDAVRMAEAIGDLKAHDNDLTTPSTRMMTDDRLDETEGLLMEDE